MSEDSGAGRVELMRALGALCEPPDPTHARLRALVGLPGPVDAASYADVFLFQLYPYASVHLGAEGMLGGEARARVAGFWRALGRVPPTEPDHLAALLGLYATLREGAGGGADAESVLVGRGADALLHEHLAPWVFGFLDRLHEIAPPPFRAWSALLAEVLRAEVRAMPAERVRTLPVHLAAAPELPDPRREGAGAFLAGLLAPVRSGVTLVRADLASVARALDLGLRAGERRYALEHMIAQEPTAVLSALSAEAARQAGRHEARVVWLGATAAFQAQRARATAELCGALAEAEAATPAGA